MDKRITFLNNWFGKPFDHNFDYDIHGIKMGLLIYGPKPDEGITYSTMVTNGLSSINTNQQQSNYECIIKINNTLLGEDFKEFGLQLLNQLFNNKFLEEHDTLDAIHFNNYPDINGFLILNYGGFEPFLWDVIPNVRVFELVPINKSELKAIKEQPLEIRHALVFRSNNVNWTELSREKININVTAINGVWTYIEKWYKEHSIKLYNQLSKGADLQMIESVESILDLKLPNDFKASIMKHNGEVYFHDYKYLSCKEISNTWKMMRKLLSDNSFPEVAVSVENEPYLNMKNCWWHEAWIPFSKDSAGNLMCIDMAPTDEGNMGQIIYWEKSSGPMPTEYKSFFHWLYAYEQAIYAGYYWLDSEGFLR